MHGGLHNFLGPVNIVLILTILLLTRPSLNAIIILFIAALTVLFLTKTGL